MAENDKHTLIAALANAAAAFAQTPLPYLVGMGVMLAATHWDGHLQTQKGCTEVQQVGGKFFKVDTCNGKVEEIPVAKVAEPPGEKDASKGTAAQSAGKTHKSEQPTAQPAVPSKGD